MWLVRISVMDSNKKKLLMEVECQSKWSPWRHALWNWICFHQNFNFYRILHDEANLSEIFFSFWLKFKRKTNFYASHWVEREEKKRQNALAAIHVEKRHKINKMKKYFEWLNVSMCESPFQMYACSLAQYEILKLAYQICLFLSFRGPHWIDSRKKNFFFASVLRNLIQNCVQLCCHSTNDNISILYNIHYA